MRVVMISDTHTRHAELGDLEGDVLIHCGDSGNGLSREAGGVDALDAWFGRQRFSTILCVGGNHDYEMQERADAGIAVFKNATYLEDRAVELGGIRFYGAPWVPELDGWAYYQDDAGLERKWALIPDDVDVLITHTPPYGILDQNRSGRHCGCPALGARLELLKPRLHCFGHIHASAGMAHIDGIQFVNAAMVNSHYQITHQPIVVEL